MSKKLVLIPFISACIVVLFYSLFKILIPQVIYDPIDVLKIAIEAKDPSKCDVLPIGGQFGDVEPRAECQLRSAVTIGNITLCDQIIEYNDSCHLEIAENKKDVSLCSDKAFDYNFCVYKVAASAIDPSICNYVKNDAKRSKTGCIYEVVGDNILEASRPPTISAQQAIEICKLIPDEIVSDHCFGNVIYKFRDSSFCSLIQNRSNLKLMDSILETVCPI